MITTNQSKLFTEELARRNPDWEKIVACHNAALAAEREVGHNQAITLGQHIARLEDQLAAAVKKRDEWKRKYEALRK